VLFDFATAENHSPSLKRGCICSFISCKKKLFV